MNLRLQNQLNMVGACITVAQSSDDKPVWNGKPPADFGTDMTKLQTDYGAVTAKAALAEAATGGGGDAKARVCQLFLRRREHRKIIRAER